MNDEGRDAATRAGLRTLSRGHHLSSATAAAIFREIMAGACEPAQIGGLLMALAIKGETMGEIPEGESLVVEWREGELREHVLRRADAGLAEQPPSDLAGGDPAANAAALRRVLAGEAGAYRDAVIHAGALALVVAGDEPISSLADQARRVAAALDGGEAAAVLDRLVERCSGSRSSGSRS